MAAFFHGVIQTTSHVPIMDRWSRLWSPAAREGCARRAFSNMNEARKSLMNSINRNQTEQNHQDLSGQEAVKKIQELVKKGQNCFFCTAVGSNGSSAARPMNVRQVDEEGNLWFLSASDSHQNKELALDPSVKLYFQGSDHSDFLQLNGKATISRDRVKIEELWEFVIKTSPKAWMTLGLRLSKSPHPKDIIGTTNTAIQWPVLRC